MANIEVTAVALVLLIVAGSLLVVVVSLLLLYVVVREAVRAGTRTALREYEQEKALRRARIEREKRAQAAAPYRPPTDSRASASASTTPKRAPATKTPAASQPAGTATMLSPKTALGEQAGDVVGQTRASRRSADTHETQRSRSWTSWWSRSTRNSASPNTKSTDVVSDVTPAPSPDASAQVVSAQIRTEGAGQFRRVS
ncbi:hypothetical protein [Pseudoclavibacter sp. 13-3]|uniref:hypothetical protein n=1 Tax=Pseudoclavibacter sp. 13-3 TaxID=2901228 RepID=UPI001E44C4FC|nr:hypothetical protein [Pseudoclavibacter sp. 13-3]MCD7102241.1 hypothetical protein [Pseudoclavibacter sp. 13-3]